MAETPYWNAFLPALLDRLSFHMRKNLTKTVEPYGLNSSHAIYILALRVQNGQTTAGLSRFLDIDNANTHRVLKVLKEKGIVYDDRIDPRSKKYHVYLTDYGKELADMISDLVESIDMAYSAGLTPEEISVTRNAVLKIMGNALYAETDSKDLKFDKPYYSYLAELAAKNDG